MAGILDHPEAQRLLGEATLAAADVSALAGRLQRFLEPYLDLLPRSEQRDNARLLIDGKLSGLQRKTTEPIANQAGVHRKPLQHFLGAGAWHGRPLLDRLKDDVTRLWADPQGVLALDGSGFPKKGDHSAGVQRQWCGRLGKIDNCQVGVFVGYACEYGHTLLDGQLYVPESWAKDDDDTKARRKAAHIPDAVGHQESWRIGLGLLEGCLSVPHAWVTADDEFGRVQELRAWLRQRGERYLVDVPADTKIRDLEAPLPVQPRRHGSLPKAPWQTVSQWAAGQAAERWQRVEVRAGEKGPVVVEALTVRVQTTWHKSHLGPEERLVVRRSAEGKASYHLSNAAAESSLEEMVKARGKHHEVEQCFQEAKGEVGLGHYEVRSWVGWHHHVTLSLLAAWFLALERSGLGKATRG